MSEAHYRSLGCNGYPCLRTPGRYRPAGVAVPHIGATPWDSLGARSGVLPSHTEFAPIGSGCSPIVNIRPALSTRTLPIASH